MVFLLGAAAVLASCQDEVICGSQPPVELRFSLVDANGQGIIGPGRTYSANDILMLNPGFQLAPGFEDTVVALPVNQWSGETTTYFELTETDRDTLEFTVVSETTECYTLKSLADFKYNGVTPSSDFGIYIIQKN